MIPSGSYQVVISASISFTDIFSTQQLQSVSSWDCLKTGMAMVCLPDHHDVQSVGNRVVQTFSQQKAQGNYNPLLCPSLPAAEVSGMGQGSCWLCCLEALGGRALMWLLSLVLCWGHPSRAHRATACPPLSLLQCPVGSQLPNPVQHFSLAPQGAAEHIIRGLDLKCPAESGPETRSC